MAHIRQLRPDPCLGFQVRALKTIEGVPSLLASLTPTSIKFNCFLELILLEHKPPSACFGFVSSQKWLDSTKINLRKRLNLIDIGDKSGPGVGRGALELVVFSNHQQCDANYFEIRRDIPYWLP